MRNGYRIGIDLGGTKTEALLIDKEGNKVFSKRISTEKNYQGTIKGIINLINEIEEKFTTVESIGIGIPGSVSFETSLIKNANSIWLNGKPFRNDLKKSLNKEIKLENDANCFALSEAVDGAGKSHSVVFGVIIGTGTGAGIVIDKKILKGKNCVAGEFGHNALPRSNDDEINIAKSCYCGLKGCIETYLSGPGFTSIFNGIHNTNFETKEIIQLYENKDSRAVEALDDYVDRLARSLSDVINVLDPDIIILGGGMSNINYIYEHIDNKLSKYVFSKSIFTKIVKNVHGDSSGVRGAAWL